MGGSAFSSGSNPLFTPRMSPKVYQHVLSTCHAKLRELFFVVATPIEGPEKKDHGDIDIFVAVEKNISFPSSGPDSTSLPPSTRDSLKAAYFLLGAEHSIGEQPNAVNLAIPWPNDLPYEGTKGDEPRYIQVDLHLCNSVEHLQWMLVKYAHGDLWNILGSTIRPYGLTADEVGLYIRIPEIENLNKRQSKVLLSSDPIEILSFLGLKYDSTQWEQPFASMEDLMEYAATCRLFWVRPKQDGSATEADGGDFDRSKMKANDRRRMKGRATFRKWYDEFIPACRKAGRFTTPISTRDTVREDAFAQFPGTRQVYKNRLLEWRKEQQRQTLWQRVIKASIPEWQEGEEEHNRRHLRSLAASSLKKIVMQDDYSLGIHPPLPLRDPDGFYKEDLVREFVVDNWRRIGEAAWEESQKKYAERLAEKGAKHTS
ncbi:hypothetical protein F4813DRAFT_186628 [Daldinia decipiens]|uniref:uncharacterized protein n=1 Tax=Daldinia decipiens TaxID=326647 RepID=UPI0020C34813|nr:uncharacterized protein F4813DRAFT_186628 [Daldinia decipiens]KAI1655281.1 hypothetical protein F4813DRAFT_186628 [Daldinia decipiens]